MLDNFALVDALTGEYGSPLYVFNEAGFEENFRRLQGAFEKYYPNYRIAYSFKTNYTPYIASTVKRLGGYAEVVSDMEYHIAKRIGYPEEAILFNGPNKGAAGIRALLNGCTVNADSLDELRAIRAAAARHPEQTFEIGLRVNIDVGQNFISRFGIDPSQLPDAFAAVSAVKNLKIVGLHCHISRCRGLDAWKKRAETMLALAGRFFDAPPKYIDLGSGMFGSMDPEFAAQFDSVPSYEEYAEAVGGLLAERYGKGENAPILFTEPGTTLVNKFVDFIGRVDAIKWVGGKHFAVLNCSAHNLGETCTLKELPMRIVPKGQQTQYSDIDFTGFTCLEQDVMRKHYSGSLAVGDYVIFGNVGGYSNVLKPPFIQPNCKMIAVCPDGTTRLMKEAESFDDILHTYVFD